MRPRDPRYNSIPLASAPNVDAPSLTLRCARRSATPCARYENAGAASNQGMVKNNKVFFDPWETIHEATRRKFWSAAKRSRWRHFSSCRAA